MTFKIKFNLNPCLNTDNFDIFTLRKKNDDPSLKLIKIQFEPKRLHFKYSHGQQTQNYTD